MTSTATHPVSADAALKTKHAAMWASGDYPRVADEVVGVLGSVLVDTVAVQPGQRVLDVAAGTGTSARPAARRGAEVTATDLTPELLEVGRPPPPPRGSGSPGRSPTPSTCRTTTPRSTWSSRASA